MLHWILLWAVLQLLMDSRLTAAGRPGNNGIIIATKSSPIKSVLTAGNVFGIFPKVFKAIYRRVAPGGKQLPPHDRNSSAAEDHSNPSLDTVQDTVTRLNYEVRCLKTQVLRYKQDMLALRREKASLRQVYEDKLRTLTADYETQLAELQETLEWNWDEEKEELIKTLQVRFEEEKSKLQDELQAVFALERESLKQELSVLQVASQHSIKTIEELKQQLKQSQEDLNANKLLLQEEEHKHVKTVAELREQLKVQQTAANAYATQAATFDMQQEAAKKEVAHKGRTLGGSSGAPGSSSFSAGKPSRRRPSRSNNK